MRSFWITGHPAADLESGPGEVRAAKIPMELGRERAAHPGESEALNSELQWVFGYVSSRRVRTIRPRGRLV